MWGRERTTQKKDKLERWTRSSAIWLSCSWKGILTGGIFQVSEFVAISDSFWESSLSCIFFCYRETVQVAVWHTDSVFSWERDSWGKGAKMSLNNGQILTISGQDRTRHDGSNSSTRAPWEDARAVLKPSTPARKPKPVRVSAGLEIRWNRSSNWCFWLSLLWNWLHLH